MIEQIIIDYLNQNLDTPVYMEVPEDPPESFVIVEKTSGAKENYIQYAMMAFQSYASTLYNAALLNEEVKSAVENMTGLSSISSVQLNSDYNYTDTSTKRYRYQAVYEIYYY